MKGYQIDMSATMEESLRNVILVCISHIEDQIRNRKDDVHGPIHETRRTIKRIRAVLRLIRDEIGYSNYYRENSFYRDLSKHLSPARDSYVLIRTISGFNKKAPSEFPEKETGRLLDLLSRKVDADLELFKNQSGGFDRILEDLEPAKERVGEYCHLRNDFSAIRKGIQRIYGNGYGFLKTIRKSHDEEQFHEYRKNTKYLLYQMELIQPAYPRLIKAYTGTIDEYGDLLGDTRDFERLAEFIRSQFANRALRASGQRLEEYTRRRITELMQRIQAEAGWIYAEKPGRFVKRLAKYWDSQKEITDI